jgi:soluble lytic murein transglycosylase-like protein
MRSSLLPPTLLLALGMLALAVVPDPAFADTVGARRYFEVRDRAQSVVELKSSSQLHTEGERLQAGLVEVRGTLIGIAQAGSNCTIFLRIAEEDTPLIFVPAAKQGEVTRLHTGEQVRVLCGVVPQGDIGRGLELRVLVREGDAATEDAERQRKAQAAAARKPGARPPALSSRGVAPRAYTAPRQQGLLPDDQLVAIYTDAVLRFNRRLPTATARHIASNIIEYSRRYALDARLVMAVIACESNFDPSAVSRMGAMGLGQLMPGTASGLGVGNVWDPRQNLEGSTRLLRNHLENMKSGGRPELDAIKLALACYNAGAGAVRKYRGIPPYRETQTYIKRITRLYWQMLQPHERTWNPD